MTGVTRDWMSPSKESMLHVVAPLWTRHSSDIIDYLWEFNVNLFHISELSCPRGWRFYNSDEKSLVFLTSECSASSWQSSSWQSSSWTNVMVPMQWHRWTTTRLSRRRGHHEQCPSLPDPRDHSGKSVDVDKDRDGRNVYYISNKNVKQTVLWLKIRFHFLTNVHEEVQF